MAGKRQTKYVFVTGGVLSGLGKGITGASLASLLKLHGLRVSIQKCDPYFNVDAGTLNPAEHGECFVTDGGRETDLDLGHYERFLDQPMPNSSSLMNGWVYRQVIEAERSGKYLGKTVQVVPHVTATIQEAIIKAGQDSDVHFVEIGGTIGDYEGLAFVEAIRELALKVGHQNHVFMHLVYVPFINTSKEFKTKPAQTAVRELRSLGITPEILVARSEQVPPVKIKDKLSMFCGIAPEAIALLPNAKTVYSVPLSLHEQGIDSFIIKRLKLKAHKADLSQWQWVADKATSEFKKTVKVGIVAKYLDNDDTYMCVVEALKAACWKHNVGLDLSWVNAEELTDSKTTARQLDQFDGIVVTGGFGARGVEGKIQAATYAIKNKKPYLGLCLGLQVAVIAAARLSGLKDANSTEFAPQTKQPVVTTMADQKDKLNTGGTMRLGSYPCQLQKGSLALKLYGQPQVKERHRHRFEVNNDYLSDIKKAGMQVSGIWPEGNLVEVIEIADHPFFIASQFHPEFLSKPYRPHPLFDGLIANLKKRLR